MRRSASPRRTSRGAWRRPGFPVMVAVVIILGAGIGCGEDEEPFLPVEREPPTGLYVPEASSESVLLRWRHPGGGVTGFEVRRWTGSTSAAPDVFTVGASAREFRDTDPDSEATLFYDVTAAYQSFRSQPTAQTVLSLDFLTPTLVSVVLEADSAIVEWLPPDFQDFDGFVVDREVGPPGALFRDARFPVDHTTSLAASWVDRNLPVGNEVLDRLRYLVSLHRFDIHSAPVPAEPELQWSYPTQWDLFTSGLPRHERAEARYHPESGFVTVSMVRDDGAIELQALETDGGGRARAVYFSIVHADGLTSGTVPDAGHVVVAHQAAGATDVIVQTYALPAGPGDPPVWESTFPGASAGVWNAPQAGAVALAAGSSALVLDPTNGTELNRIDYTAPVASIAFPTGDRILAVESASGLRQGTLRVSLRSYPDGATFWVRDLDATQLLSPVAGVIVSSSGALLALSLENATLRVLATGSGNDAGNAPGQALAFTPGGAQLLALETVPGALIAYRVSGVELIAEDEFGSLDTTSGYFLPDGHLITTLVPGGFAQWTLTRGWTPALGSIARLDPRWIFERSRTPVVPLADRRPGRRTG